MAGTIWVRPDAHKILRTPPGSLAVRSRGDFAQLIRETGPPVTTLHPGAPPPNH